MNPTEPSAAHARAWAALRADWAGREDFTLVDTGFGDGARWWALRQAWRADPARPRRLHVVGIVHRPPPLDAVQAALAAVAALTAPTALAADSGPDPALLAALAAAWPPALPGWHVVDLGPDEPRLTLVVAEPRAAVQGLDCQADALDLAGLHPAGEAWPPALLDALARRARPGALAFGAPPVDGSVAGRALAAALHRAGFVTADLACGLYRWQPRPTLRRPPARGGAPGEALMVGAGLAGGWAAHALRRDGWTVTVLDRHPMPAAEASGNPGGLFHGTVLPDDGPHARLQRAAALLAQRALAPWLNGEPVPGRIDGLLRLAGNGEPLAALQALLDRHALPDAYVQVLDAARASALAGIALDRPAWFYPGGGWLDPGALVRQLLEGSTLRGGVEVGALRRHGNVWQLLDGAGRPLAEAGTVVLANAADAARLWPAAGWPLGRSRGQISVWPQAPAGAPRPRLPVSGSGYLLAMDDGALLCGATATPGDEDGALRDADHRFNLARLQALTGWSAPWPPTGRVAWRAMTPDRLPLVGPVPAAGATSASRLDGVERAPGLYVLSGLGSRGITWGPLAARLLAAWMGGSPMPVEAALRDSLDPARWQLRAARRG